MKKVLLDSVDSTNNYAETIAHAADENILIIANDQTRGRGQFNRTWFSEPGKSITMSFLLRNDPTKSLDATKLNRIPEIIVDSIKELYGIEARVVPPNDIYIGERKVCGLLVETHYEAQKFKHAIVGIGINLNNDTFPADIAETATSISHELNHSANADELIDSLERKVELLYA